MSYQSDVIGELAAALAIAQGKIGPVQKDREVTVQTRSGSSYKFKYATLGAIIEAVRPHLAAEGLWFVQTLAPIANASEHFEGRAVTLRTTLMHKSGQWIASEIEVPDISTNQEFGSTLTYRKRYALGTLLGVAAEDDDDANTADGNTVAQTKDSAPTRKQTEKAAQKDAANDAAAGAERFGKSVLVSLRVMKKPSEFVEWYTADVRGKVEKLQSYHPDLHQQVIDALHAANDRFKPQTHRGDELE